MKKLILFLILTIGFLTVQAQTSGVKFPMGKSTIVTSDGDTAAITLTPKNTVEFVTITNKTLDAALTVNVTTTHAQAGYILYIEATADGSNRVLTFGTGMTGTALTVLASKTFIIQAVYNGSKYIVVNTKQEN